MNEIDTALIGFWRVKAIDMVTGPAVRLIGGLPGEHVEFTGDGRYLVDLGGRPGASHYRASPSADPAELDIWINNLKALGAKCIYHIDSDVLTICIAGNSGERPTELRREDERLWCLMTLERSQPPKGRKLSRAEPLLEPGSFIPKGFLEEEPSPPRSFLDRFRKLLRRGGGD